MKSIVSILTVTLLSVAPAIFVSAQDTPKPTAAASPGASASPAPRTDVYHVNFTKATVGKAAELGEFLKTQDPKAPMPGHRVVLRHQEGDSWDYAVIEHLGTKTTVEAAGNLTPPSKRDLSEWHNDTIVNGPAWADFARAMGMDDESKGKSAGSVYIVSVYRAAPGHRDQLEKMLGEPPASGDPSVGNVLMQHLEGSAWNFLTVARYKSWDDVAANEKNDAVSMAKGQGGWFELRNHAAFHTDTLTDRISP